MHGDVREIKGHRQIICSIGASIGILVGVSSLVAGMLCVLIHSLDPGDTAFNGVGTILLIISIPMLFVGATFMDKLDNSR